MEAVLEQDRREAQKTGQEGRRVAAHQDKEDWEEAVQEAETRLLTLDLDWPQAMSGEPAELEAAPLASQDLPEAAEAEMSQLRPRHHFQWPEKASPDLGCQERVCWV